MAIRMRIRSRINPLICGAESAIRNMEDYGLQIGYFYEFLFICLANFVIEG